MQISKLIGLNWQVMNDHDRMAFAGVESAVAYIAEEEFNGSYRIFIIDGNKLQVIEEDTTFSTFELKQID
jgi:hypothetical protein